MYRNCSDGKLIVSSSDDTAVRLWDAQSGVAIGKAMKGHLSRIYQVAISNGKFIASSSVEAPQEISKEASSNVAKHGSTYAMV